MEPPLTRHVTRSFNQQQQQQQQQQHQQFHSNQARVLKNSFSAAYHEDEGGSARAHESKFVSNASTFAPLPADASFYHGDVNARIAQLQQQSLQEQAVMDANAHQQVRLSVLRRCSLCAYSVCVFGE